MRHLILALLLVAPMNAAPMRGAAKSRCDDAVATGAKAITALQASIPAFFAGCAVGRTKELCADAVGVVCAASAANAVAINQVSDHCPSSLSSLGCGNSTANAQKAIAALTTTCGATLAGCRKSVLACITGVPVMGAAIAGVAALNCDTFQACNNCSAMGSTCNLNFKEAHPECKQFGPDVGCCIASTLGPCWLDPGSDLHVPITAFGQDYCCPKGATTKYPCGAPTPPPVRYKCSGNACVVDETGVTKSECEAACGPAH